ncbi:MAG: S8 family serine peptidase, partial [Acidobacteriota bacterium]
MKSNRQKHSFLTKTLGAVLLYSFIFTNIFAVGVFAKTTNESSVNAPALTKFTSDLTKLSRSGRVRANENFESETNRLIKMLASGNLQQPVILDEKGKNQEIVVEQLASRIANGDVPNNLRDVQILKLEIASLFSNAKTSAEASQIVQNVFNELANSNGKIILFVDELTNFVGNSQINNALANLLINNKVRIIGGSSKAAYSERIAPVVELSAFFAPLNIGEMQSGNSKNASTKFDDNEGFRGDNVSSDLREMMANDTTGSKRVDVIIQAKDADNTALQAMMAENGVRLQDRIGDSNTMVVSLPTSAVEALAASGSVNYMSPDRRVEMLGHIENTTGAASMRSQAATANRAAYTLDGSGVGVAIVDSGMLANHKDFTNASGASRIVFSKNFVTTSTTTDDDYGHGTHVAGIAAGNSTIDSSAYRGIAPNANIINLKVLDGQGSGQSSWLLNALQWLIENRTTYNIRVVNLSLGGLAIDSYTNDPVNRKVQELTALGVLVVAAAGNEGKNVLGQKLYGHIHSPGNDPSALTVGAVNTMQTDSRSDDVMATFSSHGPTRSFYTDSRDVKVYDNAMKPDLVAPGNKVVSSRAKATSTLATQFPLLQIVLPASTPATEALMTMSGTSMATPAVSGAAALLFQVNPNLTPQMVKMILEYTAQPLSGANMLEQGAGQLNIEGAIRLAKAYRTEVNFNTSATAGMNLLAAGSSFPTAQSVVGGTTFSWSQGILTNHAYLKGQKIASIFHEVYRNNSWFEKGVSHNSTYNYILNSNFY